MQKPTTHAATIAFVTITLMSCAPAVKFHLIENLSATLPAAKTALFIKEEIDVAGDYSSRVVLYSLPSLRSELQRHLSQPQVQHTLAEPDGTASFVSKVDNPFSIVSDSTDVNAIISIVI